MHDSAAQTRTDHEGIITQSTSTRNITNNTASANPVLTKLDKV